MTDVLTLAPTETTVRPFTDDDRARFLRDAERHCRAAKAAILAAQLPAHQWCIARHDVDLLDEIALSCSDFADGYEWRDVDGYAETEERR